MDSNSMFSKGLGTALGTGLGTGFTQVEVSKATSELRFLEIELNNFENGITIIRTEKVLQQLYVSNLGNREWKDVPIETHP
jgi:hypothetical protein